MSSPRHSTENSSLAGFAYKPPPAPPDDPGEAARWLVQHVNRQNGTTLIAQYWSHFSAAPIGDKHAILAALGAPSTEEVMGKAMTEYAASLCGMPPSVTVTATPAPAFEHAIPILKTSIQQASATLTFCQTLLKDIGANIALPEEAQHQCGQAIADCRQVHNLLLGAGPTLELLQENCKLLHTKRTKPPPASGMQSGSQTWADKVKGTMRSPDHGSCASTLEAELRADRQAKRKAAFGETRKSLRDDSRSIRLEPLEVEHPTAPGLIGRHFLKKLKLQKEVQIEDIRQDSRGSLYLQFSAQNLQKVQKAFQRREWDEELPEKENGIMIPDVGSFEYGEPRISTTAGLVPVVISGVAKEWSPEDIESEIRLENADRWGLPTEVASSPEAFRQHVRCDQRLNRRSESHGKVTWLPSNAIRCWVPSDLVQDSRRR